MIFPNCSISWLFSRSRFTSRWTYAITSEGFLSFIYWGRFLIACGLPLAFFFLLNPPGASSGCTYHQSLSLLSGRGRWEGEPRRTVASIQIVSLRRNALLSQA